MPKRIEDRIEDEVRRRMTQIASSAGVDQGRIELEILWMLPSEFVRMYREVFDRALAEPIRSSSDGGKDEGRVPAKGSVSRKGVEGGAKSGKRWVSPGWIVRSEAALAKKRNLDRRIVRAVEQALREMDPIRAAEKRKSGDSSGKPKCLQCGQYQNSGWVRCPFHT